MKTSSAGGVVVGSDGSVVICSQKGNSWSLPKGHIEEGETPVDAAIREVKEETGLTQLRLLKSFAPYSRYKISVDGKGEDRSEEKEIFMFLFITTEVSLKPVDPENPEARWISPQEVVEHLTHPKDREFFQSILKEVEDARV